MHRNGYFMRDLNGSKIDGIMDFNLVQGRSRSRSVFEFGVFLSVVLGYLCVLAFSA